MHDAVLEVGHPDVQAVPADCTRVGDSPLPYALPPAHVPSLDGLRALAVVAVMAVHSGAPGFELGWLGVDVFFVLSGFLITTLLVREFRRAGTISLPKFWARRALRLMPAYWLYVGTLCAMMALGVGTLHSYAGWTPAAYIASLWGYFVNYAPMGEIWLPWKKCQWLTLALWSLAVEEQFYLLWPGLLCVLLRVGKGRGAAAFAWAVALAILIYRAFVSDVRLTNELPTRGIGIVIGCAAALTLAGGARGVAPRWRAILSSAVIRAAVIAATGLSLAVLTVLRVRGRVSEGDVHRYCVPALDLLFAAGIAMLWYGPRDLLAGALAWRPLAFVGKISYGMYLYHMAAHVLVWEILLARINQWPQWPKFGLRVGAFYLITLLLASASYYLLEKPFLRLKNRLR